MWKWWLVVVGCMGGCLNVAVQPPAPPPPVELPADVKQSLPTDATGRPILGQARAGGEGSLSIALVYDEKLDDPITRWGACLERVVACKQANMGHSIKDCVPLIPRCADDTGGAGCCPGTCIDAFASAAASGMGDTQAVRQTFLKGDCVAGFAAFVASDEPVQP